MAEERTVSLRMAALVALRYGGMQILHNPSRFLGLVLDGVDPDVPTTCVFERNCDAELLGIYARAADSFTTESARNAASQATVLLNEERCIDLGIAAQVAGELTLALADYFGVALPKEELGTAPGNVQGKVMEPQEVPAAHPNIVTQARRAGNTTHEETQQSSACASSIQCFSSIIAFSPFMF